MGDIEQSHGDREAPGPEWGDTRFRGGVSRLNKPEVTSSKSSGITTREAEQPQITCDDQCEGALGQGQAKSAQSLAPVT